MVSIVLGDIKSKLYMCIEDFESSNVKVIVVNDITGLRMPNGEVINASRGEEIEIPRWLANYLESKGLVRRKWGELGLEDLMKIHYREANRKSLRELSSLPKNFYWLAKEYIEHIDSLIKENPTPTLLREKERMLTFLREIIDKRLKAILTIAVGREDVSTYTTKLSPEELMLFHEVRELIQEWKKTLTGGYIE